jgi:hypothetical protein
VPNARLLGETSICVKTPPKPWIAVCLGKVLFEVVETLGFSRSLVQKRLDGAILEATVFGFRCGV